MLRILVSGGLRLHRLASGRPASAALGPEVPVVDNLWTGLEENLGHIRVPACGASSKTSTAS